MRAIREAPCLISLPDQPRSSFCLTYQSTCLISHPDQLVRENSRCEHDRTPPRLTNRRPSRKGGDIVGLAASATRAPVRPGVTTQFDCCRQSPHFTARKGTRRGGKKAPIHDRRRRPTPHTPLSRELNGAPNHRRHGVSRETAAPVSRETR